MKKGLYVVPSHKYGLGAFINNVQGSVTDGKYTDGLFNGMSEGLGNAMGAIGSAVGGVAGGLIGGGRTSAAGDIIGGLGKVASAIPGPWGAIAGVGLGAISGLTNAAFGVKLNQENVNAVNNNITAMNSFQSNAGSFDALAQNFMNQPTSMRFNQNFIGKNGWFNKGATKKYNELVAKQDAAQQFVNNSLTNNMNNLVSSQNQNLLANYAAYGGPLGVISGPIDYSMAMQYLDMKNKENKDKLLAKGGYLHSHGADWNTGLNYVGNGGSHEENPYEGVPIGIAPDGQPNLVEEGEVIWNNDYVFSKRLKVPKAIRRKYRLGGVKPLTFAEAAMKANKEAEERPNDPITLRGRDAILGALAEVQDMQRAKKEAKEQPEGMPMLEGIQPMVAANGGEIHIDKNKRGTFTAAASRHGKSVQEFASQVLANPENYSPAMRKKANFARNAAKWHSNGGHLFPLGGEYLDWLESLTPDDYNTLVNNIGGKALNYRNNPEGLFKFANYKKPGPVYEGLQNAYMYSNPPGLNGPLNPEIERGIDIPNVVPFNIPTNRLSKLEDIGEGMYSVPNSRGEVTFNLLNASSESRNGQDTPSSNTDWVSRLRYIPAIGAGIGVLSDLFGWTNKPDYSQADAIARAARGMGTISASPIGDYLTYRPMDRMFALNMLNANAGANRRAILDTAGGNRGTAIAGLLASDNNTLNNIGNLFRQAEEYNAQQRERVATFNRATNMFNSELDLNAQKANLGRDEVVMRGLQAATAMRDAIDQRVGTARSINLTNLFESLGDIGREAAIRNMINSNPAWMYDIGWDGIVDYARKSNGGKIKNKKGKK